MHANLNPIGFRKQTLRKMCFFYYIVSNIIDERILAIVRYQIDSIYRLLYKLLINYN